MMNKIILYYQTFTGLEKIYKKKDVYLTHLHLSSLHFGNNNTNNKPYIHLNDNSPYDHRFDSVWQDMVELKKRDVKIVVMLGGAGGAYEYMFSNDEIYNQCLELLIKLFEDKKDIIDGIDLDVEEYVGLDNILKLINDLNNRLPSDFLITMAPVSDYIMDDTPGMGGFKYSDVLKSDIGKRISYFNGQFYNDISQESTLCDDYNRCLKNIPRELLVLGVENVNQDYYDNLYSIVSNGDISGVYFWEYFNMPDDFIENVYFILNNERLDLTFYQTCNLS